MIEQLAERLTAGQIKRGGIDESQKALYKYGYIVLIEMSINILLTVVIGILSGKMSLVISFSLIFIPLRSYCGGWHAPKDWLCMLFSLGTLLLVVFGEQCFFLSGSVVFFLELISFVVILFLAPIDSNTKRLDEGESNAFRKIARIILMVEILVLLAAIYFHCRILLLSIIFAHGLQSISLLLCIPQKSGRKMDRRAGGQKK